MLDRVLTPLGRLGLAAPFIVLVAPFLVSRPIADPSPWLHLRVGDYLRSGARFGLPDPWSPFTSHPYVPTQWLPSMVVSALVDEFGLAAVVWVHTIGVVAVGTVVYIACRQCAPAPVSLATTAVTMTAAWPTLTERPQLLGFVLLVPTIAMWQAVAADGRPRWALVPLTWLLACVHGVWSLGLAVGAICVATSSWPRPTRTRLAACWIACLLAAACTPLGPGLLTTPFHAGANGRQFVEEWLPSSARELNVACALAMLVALLATWLWRRVRPHAWQLTLLALACVLVLAMRRTVPVGAFILAPMLATAWARTGSAVPSAAAPRLGVPRLEWAALAAAVLSATLIAVPLARSTETSSLVGVPQGFTSALKALPAGTHVVAEGDVTGWLLYAAPNVRPVFDVRIEVYSSAYVQSFVDAMAARPGWDSFISGTQATVAVLPRSSPLAVALEEGSHWRLAGHDKGFVLLERP